MKKRRELLAFMGTGFIFGLMIGVILGVSTERPQWISIINEKNEYILELESREMETIIVLNASVEEISTMNIYEYTKKISSVYNVDTDLMMAIFKHETGNFTSDLFKYNNNICGMYSNGQPVYYENVEQSIIACVRNIRINYINVGLTTIESIGEIYAPLNDKKDSNKVNQYWIPKVTKFYEEDSYE